MLCYYRTICYFVCIDMWICSNVLCNRSTGSSSRIYLWWISATIVYTFRHHRHFHVSIRFTLRCKSNSQCISSNLSTWFLPPRILFCLFRSAFFRLVHFEWWWRGVVVNALVVINEVTLRRARLVLGWVIVCGRVNHLGM